MNRVFYWMIVTAVLTAAFFSLFGQWLPPTVLEVVRADYPAELADATVMEAVSIRLFDGVKAAVMTVVLPLIGGMAFFLGIMKLAEKSGLMLIVAKLLRPVMIRLFPDVPPNHPAMSAMIMNIAANALGLGNAATPFGLKAMTELESLNPEKGTATNAMALFLAINTGGMTLMATTVMNQRAALGSHDPAAVIGTTLVATMFGTTAALVSCKIAERFSPAPTAPLPDASLPLAGDPELLAAPVVPPPPLEPVDTPYPDDTPYPLWGSLLAVSSVIPFAVAAIVFGKTFSQWIVPLMILGFASWAYWRDVPIYETFIEGAREGFEIGVRIIPYLVAILGVVGMLRGAGTIALFGYVVGPLTEPFGMPAEALPMVLLRPLSGSGATGLMMSIMTEYGPDSYIGYLVSTLQGSTETTFYVLAVYFGSVGIKRIRHAMIPGLVADLFGAIGAVVAVQAYFRMAGLAF